MEVNLKGKIDECLSIFKGKRMVVTKVLDKHTGGEMLIPGNVINMAEFTELGYEFVNSLIVTLTRIEVDEGQFIGHFEPGIDWKTGSIYNSVVTSTYIEIPSIVELYDEHERVFIQTQGPEST